MRSTGVKAAAITCLAVVLVCASAASGPAASGVRPWPAAQEPQPLLGLFARDGGSFLARVDRDTLGPTGARAVLRPDQGPWAFSPDRTRVAIAHLATPPLISVVDVDRMRLVRDLPTHGGTDVVAWLSPDRIAWLEFHRVVVADPTTGATVRTTPLALAPLRAGFLPGALVLLLAPENRIGQARLAVVDDSGRVRTVRLRRTRASAFLTGGRERHPGLAVDPAGRRAYVVGAGEPAASVDLRTLRVAYHSLGSARRLAKGAIDGPTRRALWLGNGLLAVTGEDGRIRRTTRGEATNVSSEPAGVAIVDVRTWRAVRLDGDATHVALAGDRLLGYGTSLRSGQNIGAGLDVYAPGGRRVGHLFARRAVWSVEALGDRAVVGLGDFPQLVDLSTLSVVRTLPATVPLLLLGAANDWLG